VRSRRESEDPLLPDLELPLERISAIESARADSPLDLLNSRDKGVSRLPARAFTNEDTLALTGRQLDITQHTTTSHQECAPKRSAL
jgi:hypothetical protein